MNDGHRPLLVGSVGSLASVSLGELNHLAGLLVALVTIAAVLPVAIKRWRNINKDSAPPFPPLGK